jgi:hypothetical protein
MPSAAYAECRCGECRGAKKNYGLTQNRKKSYSRRIKIRPVKVCLHGRLESQIWHCVFAVCSSFRFSFRCCFRGKGKMLTVELFTGKILTVKMLTVKVLTVKVLTVKMLTVKMLTVKMLTFKMLTVKMLTVKVLTVKMLTVKMLTVKMLTVKMLIVKLLTVKTLYYIGLSNQL